MKKQYFYLDINVDLGAFVATKLVKKGKTFKVLDCWGNEYTVNKLDSEAILKLQVDMFKYNNLI